MPYGPPPRMGICFPTVVGRLSVLSTATNNIPSNATGNKFPPILTGAHQKKHKQVGSLKTHIIIRTHRHEHSEAHQMFPSAGPI